MNNEFSSIEDFMAAISGKWLNPSTNTRFHFVTDTKQPGFGQVNIFQPEIKTPVVLNTSGKWRNKQVMLVVENEYYEIAMMGSLVKSLFITLSPDNVLHLVKKD